MTLCQEWRHLVIRPRPLDRQEEGRPATLDPSTLRENLLLVQLRPTGAEVSPIQLCIMIFESWEHKVRMIDLNAPPADPVDGRR